MQIEFEDLHINEKFRDLLRPLTQDEFERLEKSIVDDKGFIRDPLILWKFENKHYIVDGHNRYKVMEKHNYKEFDYVILEDMSEFQIEQWMINNQLAKRNLTDKEKALLIGMDYNSSKKEKGFQNKKVPLGKSYLMGSKPTAEIIADKHNVSDSTVKNNGKFVDSLNTITKNIDDKEKAQEFKNKILTEEIQSSKKDIIDIAKESKEFQKKFVDEVEKRNFKNFKQAKDKVKRDFDHAKKTDEISNKEKYIWFTEDCKDEIILKYKFQDVSNKFIQESFQLILSDISTNEFQNFKNEISKMKSILKPSGFIAIKCSPIHIGELISKISKMKSMEYYYTYIEKRDKKKYIETRRTESEYDYWIVFQKVPHKAIHTNIKDTINMFDIVEKFTTQSSVILDSTGNIKNLDSICKTLKRKYIKCKQLS